MIWFINLTTALSMSENKYTRTLSQEDKYEMK